MWKKVLIVALILILPVLLFKDSLTNFFYQDDFFNMALANRGGPLAAFNIFIKPPLDFYFYRPLTTQFFWWLGQQVFGLNPFGYHLLIWVFFLANIILVYILIKQILNSEKVALLTTFFYAVSASHFYRLFFLSQFQEILLTTLVLLTIILYIRGSPLTIISFILALCAKETAVVVPLILFIYEGLFRKRRWPLFLIITSILILYVLIRKFFFGFASGTAYDFNLHPKSILNNYLWYILWSLGLPEAYVNLKIFTFPTIFNPKLLTEFGVWGNRTLVALVIFLTLIFSGFRSWIKKVDREVKVPLFALTFFVITLLPVAFFPFHKFAYSVTLPLFGLALGLGVILSAFNGTRMWLIIVVALIFSFCATKFNLTNHWAKKRAETAQSVWKYLQSNYPNPHALTDIYFIDETVTYCWPPLSKFRQSQELAYAIGGEGGLKLLYHDPQLKVYFADWDDFAHLSRFSLVLDSRQFLP